MLGHTAAVGGQYEDAILRYQEAAKLAERAGPDENHRPGAPAVPHPRSGGLTAMEPMLAGAELLMVGCGEEEAW